MVCSAFESIWCLECSLRVKFAIDLLLFSELFRGWFRPCSCVWFSRLFVVRAFVVAVSELWSSASPSWFLVLYRLEFRFGFCPVLRIESVASLVCLSICCEFCFRFLIFSTSFGFRSLIRSCRFWLSSFDLWLLVFVEFLTV